MEIWFYDGSERVAYEFYLIFVQKIGQRRFWLWRPRDGLQDLVDTLMSGPTPFWEGLEQCQDGDSVARIIRSLLNDPMEFDLLEARLLEPTKSPSPEWVATFASYSTDLPEGAGVFPAELELDLPRPLPEPHRDARHRPRQDRRRRQDRARRPEHVQLPARRRGPHRRQAVRELPLQVRRAGRGRGRHHPDDVPAPAAARASTSW